MTNLSEKHLLRIFLTPPSPTFYTIIALTILLKLFEPKSHLSSSSLPSHESPGKPARDGRRVILISGVAVILGGAWDQHVPRRRSFTQQNLPLRRRLDRPGGAKLSQKCRQKACIERPHSFLPQLGIIPIRCPHTNSNLANFPISPHVSGTRCGMIGRVVDQLRLSPLRKKSDTLSRGNITLGS